MQRNKTIIALSDAMVLIEARDEGGTFEAGKSALRLKRPLFVAQYETATEQNAGNDYLLKRGATALLKNPQTGRANLDLLREVVQREHKTQSNTQPPAQQLPLMA